MKSEKEVKIAMAFNHMRRARDLLAQAGCEQSLKRVRATLKSVEGALRNRRAQDRRDAWREERAGNRLPAAQHPDLITFSLAPAGGVITHVSGLPRLDTPILLQGQPE